MTWLLGTRVGRLLAALGGLLAASLAAFLAAFLAGRRDGRREAAEAGLRRYREIRQEMDHADVLAAMLLLILNGCANELAGEAVCAGTAAARTTFAAALVADGGPESRAAGRTLIAQFDSGCRD